MKHRWDRNEATGLSTCKRGCGIIVKTYRIKHGGIAPCNPKVPPIPKCLNNDERPPRACVSCSGRMDDAKCDRMRAYYVANPPVSAE